MYDEHDRGVVYAVSDTVSVLPTTQSLRFLEVRRDTSMMRLVESKFSRYPWALRPTVSLDVISLVQAVAGMIVVTSSHPLRINWWCTGRHIEGPRNVQNTCSSTRSPSHTFGSVTVGIHGGLRGLHRAGTTIRDNPVDAHGRRNDPIAAQFLVMRGLPSGPLLTSWQGLTTLDTPWKLLI